MVEMVVFLWSFLKIASQHYPGVLTLGLEEDTCSESVSLMLESLWHVWKLSLKRIHEFLPKVMMEI